MLHFLNDGTSATPGPLNPDLERRFSDDLPALPLTTDDAHRQHSS
jgi:hypothetical protein